MSKPCGINADEADIVVGNRAEVERNEDEINAGGHGIDVGVDVFDLDGDLLVSIGVDEPVFIRLLTGYGLDVLVALVSLGSSSSDVDLAPFSLPLSKSFMLNELHFLLLFVFAFIAC